MQELKRRLSEVHKSPEESANTIEDLANLLEFVVWTPVILLLRWPWWPAVQRARKKFHHSTTYGELGRLCFDMLCALGLICQLLIIWTLFASSIMTKQLTMPDTTALGWFLLVYASLTVGRIYFWMSDELST